MFHVDRLVWGPSGGGGSECGRSTAVGTVTPSFNAEGRKKGRGWRVCLYRARTIARPMPPSAFFEELM
jgi:hypothetical protein